MKVKESQLATADGQQNQQEIERRVQAFGLAVMEPAGHCKEPCPAHICLAMSAEGMCGQDCATGDGVEGE